MSVLSEVIDILRLSAGIHRVRPRDNVLVALGFLVASATLVILLAIPAGLDRIGGSTGADDVAIVLSARAFSESESDLSPQEINLIRTLPQIARDGDGQPLAAPQFIANVKLARRDGVKTTVQVRGVDAMTWSVLGSAPVNIDGARPRDGNRELVAGAIAANQHPELERATPLVLRNASWRISGTMASGGNLWESELWADLSALQAAYNAAGRVSLLWVKLPSTAAYRPFAEAVRDEPRLQDVRVIRQSEYFRRQVGFLSDIMRMVAAGISLLLGLGAALTIANALSAALRTRRREAGILRAIGFRSPSIALAALVEVLLLGTLASLLAVFAVYLALDGNTFGTSNGHHAVYARFEIGPSVALPVLAYSLLLGLCSALLPVWRMAFGGLVDALRAD